MEAVVDIATGVGKTYVLASAIEYLAQDGVRNFAVITPGCTILNKTVGNFTAGHPKSLLGGMDVHPVVITSDNFKTPAMRAAMDDPDQVNCLSSRSRHCSSRSQRSGARRTSFKRDLAKLLRTPSKPYRPGRFRRRTSHVLRARVLRCNTRPPSAHSSGSHGDTPQENSTGPDCLPVPTRRRNRRTNSSTPLCLESEQNRGRFRRPTPAPRLTRQERQRLGTSAGRLARVHRSGLWPGPEAEGERSWVPSASAAS